MEIFFEKGAANNIGYITIKITPQDYQAEFDRQAKNIAKNIDLKGFRPGKVPVELVKKRYGDAIRSDVLEKKVNQTLYDYIHSNEIRVVGVPFLRKGQSFFDVHQLEKEKQQEKRFNVFLLPEISFNIDESIVIDYPHPKVEEGDIENRIKFLQSKHADVQDLDEITLEASFTAYVSSIEDSSFNHVGFFDVKKFIPDVQSMLLGLKNGDTVDLPLSKAYQEIENAFREISSQEKEFLENHKVQLKINRIFKQQLPGLNETFFKNFSTEEFPIQDEQTFREYVRRQLQGECEQIAHHQANKAIKNYFFDRLKVEFEKELVKEYFQGIYKHDTNALQKLEQPEYFQNLYHSFCQQAIIESLVLKFSIEVTDDEIYQEAVNRLRSYSALYGISPTEKQFAAWLKEFLESENGKKYYEIKEDLKEQKVLQIIRQKVQLLPRLVTLHELKGL
ncbi:MAG: hypothetical protein NZM38_07030 [Cytophagales bacterium]|nr:hypothetical protein [Cytophagales bacterium]MDW8384510.1 trigger factor [Flammeovirgaceae bacterium]